MANSICHGKLIRQSTDEKNLFTACYLGGGSLDIEIVR